LTKVPKVIKTNMRSQSRRTRMAFTLILLLLVFEFCASSNDSWTNSRDSKMRVIKKLRKDFRKLKKQEGALKLTGGDNSDYQGTALNFLQIRTSPLIHRLFNLKYPFSD